MKTHSIESLQKAKKLKKAPEEIAEKIHEDDIRDCIDEIAMHKGDLRLEGDLDIHDGTLFVDGNLEVTGSISTEETGTLVVTGNVSCHHLYLEGNLEVQKNAKISGVIYGFYEAGISRVGGKTKAHIGLFGNHDWECDDEQYDVVGRFSNHHALNEGDPEKLRKALGDKAFNGLSHLMGISDKAPDIGNDAWGLKLFKDV